MKLDSLHNNPISEKVAPPEADPLDALKLGAPEGDAPAPEGQEGALEGQEGALEEPAETGAHPQHKVTETIDAVEKLQSAAAALEAAGFAIQSEWSDFTLAQALGELKQQLIPLIGKAKQHMMQAGVKDPQAEQEVASWLDM